MAKYNLLIHPLPQISRSKWDMCRAGKSLQKTVFQILIFNYINLSFH